ncbi:MAG: hypothetical protein HYR51_09140 [Candidatus Rokubacteria bacterium]|nr:hypothetical protein [Candidatus Rokubacteria bacterium]
MTPGMRTVRSGLRLLPLGFVAGLAMSLYAFVPMVPVPAALARYDDLPRRLLRLAHIAAIMLPLINVVLGPWIDRVPLSRRGAAWASALLRFGAAGLPVALAIEAFIPPASAWHLAAPPAIAFSLGVLLIGLGAWHGARAPEKNHADSNPDVGDARRSRHALADATGRAAAGQPVA